MVLESPQDPRRKGCKIPGGKAARYQDVAAHLVSLRPSHCAATRKSQEVTACTVHLVSILLRSGPKVCDPSTLSEALTVT